ncbi:MAG: tetratricopeptide repeat protein [Candidatus Methanosuratincola sp.]
MATARPVGPAPSHLIPEEDAGSLSFSHLIRPVAEGVAICVVIGLFYLIIGFFVSHTYTPLLQLYQSNQGLLWLALFTVGCAWASKDERENSFLTGALSGLFSGFFLAVAEILFLAGPFCLRYVMAATLTAGAVGLVAGTIAGIVGSPVIVRFPTSQKRLALLLIIGGVISALIIAALPVQDETFHSRMARAYYDRKLYFAAARHFEKAYQLQPFDARTNSDLAVCYAQLGLRDASVDLLEKAVAVDRLNRKRDPNYIPIPEPYKNLAISYFTEGMQLGDAKMLAAAANHFNEYIQLVPDAELSVFLDLMNTYLQLGQPEQALAVAEQAIQLYPDDAALNEQLGELRKRVRPDSASVPPAPTGTTPGETNRKRSRAEKDRTASPEKP